MRHVTRSRVVLTSLIVLLAISAPGAMRIAAQDATPAATPEVCSMSMGMGTPIEGSVSGTTDARTPVPVDPASLQFDLVFLDMMIPLREMAVAMASLAQSRSTRTEVVSLAAAIVAAQSAEVEQMRAWRDTWYPGVPTLSETDVFAAFDVQAADNPGRGGFPGMEEMSMGAMTAGMARLCAATDLFDLRFINEMAQHHDGAILIAQFAVGKAVHPELAQLAQRIVDTQTAELTRMLSWRDAWFGGVPNAADPILAGTPTG